MNGIIETVKAALLSLFGSQKLAVTFLSAVPIIETRGAVPIAIGYGLKWYEAWLFTFLGSSMVIPILLAIFLPLINWLMRSRLFGRIASVVYEKFEKRSKSMSGNLAKTNTAQSTANIDWDGNEKIQHSAKTIAGLFLLVLIPVPLTGVWTGCAIASIMRFKFKTAFFTILISNFFASLIVTILCVAFADHIHIITLVVGIIAILAVVALIIKIAMHKPDLVKNSVR